MQMRVEGILVPISMAHGAGDGGVPVAIKPSVSIISLSWDKKCWDGGLTVTWPLELVSELLLIGIPERWRLAETIH